MYIIIQVVVWLPGTDEEFDEGLSRQRVEAGDRLVIVSRATTHLVVVEEAEKKDVEEAQVEVEVEDVVDGSGRLTAVMKCYFIVSCI